MILPRDLDPAGDGAPPTHDPAGQVAFDLSVDLIPQHETTSSQTNLVSEHQHTLELGANDPNEDRNTEPTQHVLHSSPSTGSLAADTTNVRLNFISYLRQRWRATQGISRMVVLTSFTISMCEVVAGILVLSLCSHECSSPLLAYAIGYICATSVDIPLKFWSNVAGDDIRRQINDEADDRFTHQRYNRVLSALRNTSTLVFATLFIYGNSVFYRTSPTQCSPGLYWLSLAYLISSYLEILFPSLICAAAIFCLPCVLAILRRYVPPDALERARLGWTPAPPSVISGLRTFTFQQTLDDNGEGDEPMCSICLSKYSEGETLKEVTKWCVLDWLCRCGELAHS